MSEQFDDRAQRPLREDQEAQERCHDHRLAVERLLWTPTQGQDLTKSYFPLSPDSENSDAG